MKVAENNIDTKFLLDLAFAVLLVISFVLYIDNSSDFQEFLAALKYNSIEGLNSGLAALDSTGRR